MESLSYPTVKCTVVTGFDNTLSQYCSAGASGVQGGLPPLVGNSPLPPMRIHKVILQETTVTMVLYTLPAVEVRQLVINVAVYSLLMTHS